ncbi:MAG: conserved phage C-terminal domain-containing protein [Deltaproteobacteria bacterium]|nr:conserved phage C-terminal domain-containing protein [Deltaproteobacteria bacterium]
MGYTKLFNEIIMSTVWRESDPTRLLWITMLALKDRWHIVNASMPGLADAARITIEECRQSLETLSQPDPHSRSKEHEGRRIEPCDGGWVILNGEKYRNKMSLDERREYQRLKQREYREKKKASDNNVKSCLQSSQQLTHTEAETKADTNNKTFVGQSPTLPIKNNFRKEAKEIIVFLNEKTGKAFQPVDANINFIVARLKEGATITNCRQVIARKVREWKGDEENNKYLRPATLFNKSKFWQYEGECVVKNNG